MRSFVLGVCLACALGLVALGVAPAGPAFGDQAKAAKKFHQDNGLNCDDCHQENPPAKDVAGKVCLDCHAKGDRKKVQELTKEIEPNPHEDHEGGLDCTACHHEHKASEDHCVACHSFGFKTP